MKFVVILTGVAGFIGYHTAKTLLNQGHKVIGVDNLNDYYDVNLKMARLEKIKHHENFIFLEADIADAHIVTKLQELAPNADYIINLAAQAGVRYSLQNPRAYTRSNVEGHLNMLELAREIRPKHFVYASSSSVYGHNKKLPFSTEDKVSSPVSLYAATKLAGEALSYSYSSLYDLQATGLRFFTVYGPWGRPDMAIYLFTKAIAEGNPIYIYNNGEMKRDFTYIDDIVAGILAATFREVHPDANNVRHKLYNLGNNKSEDLMDFVAAIEDSLGKKAIIEYKEMQPGDMKETYADISSSVNELGFAPKTAIKEGVKEFVGWYKKYHDL